MSGAGGVAIDARLVAAERDDDDVQVRPWFRKSLRVRIRSAIFVVSAAARTKLRSASFW